MRTKIIPKDYKELRSMHHYHRNLYYRTCKNQTWYRFNKEQALDRDGRKCTVCSSPDNLEVHHIVQPQTGGHPYDQRNLQTLCRPCHRRIDNPSHEKKEPRKIWWHIPF